MATLFLALLSCNNENAASSGNLVIDSVSSQMPDTSTTQIDTATAQYSEEEDDGEEDGVHSYDFNGIYVGTDPNFKLELAGSRFQCFEGSQIKMKGECIIVGVNPTSLVLGLYPFGKNKKDIKAVLGLNEFDDGQWVIYEGDTLFKKTVDESYQ